MRRWNWHGLVVALAALAVEQGCFFKKSPPKASIVIPPAPAPEPPKPLPTPPQLPAGEPPARAAEKVSQMPQLPPPVEPKKPARKPVRRPTPVPQPAAVEQGPSVNSSAPEQPPVAPPAGPSLQPILAPKQAQERNARIQKYLDKARLMVLQAERRNPDARRKELIAQVRTFLQQAEEARKVDLARAENLAERAEVLSRGLEQ
jgi:hypothetical protein